MLAPIMRLLGRGVQLLLGLALLLVLGLLASAGWLPGRPAPAGRAQWAPDSATVRMAAGPEYAAGPLWRTLWGAHHRAVWAVPVTAPVLRLGPTGPAGLRVLRAGGSFQSRTLRLRSDDGREFVLRSVNKDARSVLPAGRLREWLGPLVRDFTSAGHPYGAYPAAALAEAAGVLHANPRLVYVANEPALGPYRAAYAHALYLFEERPEGDQRHAPTLGQAGHIASSAAVLQAWRAAPPTPATARAYLRARLLDLWLGDWSRRSDQWRWAQGPGPRDWRPIPRDRDQAFYCFRDGLYPALIAAIEPKYQTFGPRLTRPQVAALAHTARPLDTLLLRQLPRAAFAAEADTLQRRLTDAAIAQALQTGPPEVRKVMLDELGPALRARRQQLGEVSGWFFEAVHESK